MMLKRITQFACLSLFFISSVPAQSLLINEFLAINHSDTTDEYNEHDDWIEIVNNSPVEVDINGYYITDDANNDLFYRLEATGHELTISPGEYLILWADGTPEQGSKHIDFKLSGRGEQIYLLNTVMQIVDSITYKEQRNDISMGRNIDNSDIWGYFEHSTPGQENNSVFYNGFTSPPLFSAKGGLYGAGLSVNLLPFSPGSFVFYTLDNSSPTTSSTSYSLPIHISTPKVIRAMAHKEGCLPSRVESHAYIINENYQLPVIAIITDSSNLWSPTGIYSNPWEEGPEWEKFCQIQYFNEGKLNMQTDAGIRIQGGNSLDMEKKSFRLFFKNEYGTERLEYPIFGSNNIASFKNMALKSGYDDDITMGNGTLLRDALASELWNETGGLPTCGSWAMLYLNHMFWGLYNIRESINEHYIMDRTGLKDFDLIRYTKEGPVLKYGTMQDWDTLMVLLDSLDFSDSTTFYTIAEYIDIDYFINLVAFIQCSQYKNWPWGVSAFKKHKEGERWQYTIWDADKAFTDLNWNGFINAQDTTRIRWGNYLVMRLLENEIFNHMLINRICDLLNTVFIPDNSICIFDYLYHTIKSDMPKEMDRWNPSNTTWENNVQSIRDFLTNRPDILYNQIKAWFSLEETHDLTLQISGEGNIQVNTVKIRRFPWKGTYFKDTPFEVVAIPKPGYTFTGWNKGDKKSSHIMMNLISDTTLHASFKPDSSSPFKEIIINEICYLPNKEADSDDWIEMYNPNPFSVDISNWILKDNDDAHRYIFPANTRLQPHAFLVVAEDIHTFLTIFPEITNVIGEFGSGTYGFGLSSNNDMLRLYTSLGVLVDSVHYQNGYPWPWIEDETGGSIQLIDPFEDNVLPSNWKYSTQHIYTPGAVNLFNTTTVSNKIPPLNTPVLSQNYPNPFRNYTRIPFSLPFDDNIEIKVFNTSMQLIKIVANGKYKTGDYEVVWDGTNASGTKMPPGIYFYYLRSSTHYSAKKMILLH